MAEITAGLLMVRKSGKDLEFFLVHPGGPFFVRKNEGAWTIPKGLPEGNESLLETACREFFEETGITPTPPYHPLGTVKLKSGKIVHAWTFEGEWDPQNGIVSNVFQMEWPRGSGKMREFVEVDRASWAPYDTAMKLINPMQAPLLARSMEFFLPS